MSSPGGIIRLSGLLMLAMCERNRSGNGCNMSDGSASKQEEEDGPASVHARAVRSNSAQIKIGAFFYSNRCP